MNNNSDDSDNGIISEAVNLIVIPTINDDDMSSTVETATYSTHTNAEEPSSLREYRLPNARQNQVFCIQLETLVDFPKLTEIYFSDSNADHGLTLSDGIISGEPKYSGDSKLLIQGLDESGKKIVIQLILLVNPDPRSLWSEIEPTSSLFRKPHKDYQSLQAQQVTLTAARIRGRSHAHKGSFCEDDIAISYDEKLGYLGMVSDGAGSSRYSRLASATLTESLPRNLYNEFDKFVSNGSLNKFKTILNSDNAQHYETYIPIMGKLLGNAVQHAFLSLTEYTSLGDGIRLKDLYATCLVFWAMPIDNQRWVVTSYWVGDGGLVIEHGDTVTLLGRADSGEFSGQTRFLTHDQAHADIIELRTQTGIYDNLRSIWAMTDGITDAKFANEIELENSQSWKTLIEEMKKHLHDESICYEWLNFWSQGEHDDRAFAAFIVNNNANVEQQS